MKVVVQRVSQASVDVVNELGTIDPTFEPQQIGPGFMLLVGVKPGPICCGSDRASCCWSA